MNALPFFSILQFHLKAFEFNTTLFFVNNKVSLQTMHLPLKLTPHLSSLLPFLKKEEEEEEEEQQQQEQVIKSSLDKNKCI